jgi:transcriptional regulator with XRE-family HTH domain
MSSITPQNYLRTHRRKIGFTQKEVAFLLGCRHPNIVSRYERTHKIPRLNTVLAYEIIFQTSSKLLFRGLVEQIETETYKRMQELLSKTKQKTHSRHILKTKHLQTVMSVLPSH